MQPKAGFQMVEDLQIFTLHLPSKIKRHEKVTEPLSLGLFGNLLQIFNWTLQVGFIQEIQINTDTLSSQMRKIKSLQIVTQSHISNGLFGVLPKCIIK